MRASASRSRRASVLVALVGLALTAPTAIGATNGSELEKLREAIRESRERVGGHERQERALLDELERSDRQLAALRQEVKEAHLAAETAGKLSVALEAESARAGRRLEATRRSMATRVVALYKAGEIGPVRFLFASSSMPEMLERVSALETFVEYDALLVDRYRRERDEADRLRSATAAAADERDATARRLEERSRALAGERRARRALLTRVREDRSQERALLVELEKAARALEETLAALGDEAARGPDAGKLAGLGFARRRGALAWPLASRIELAFGRVVDDEFRTVTFRKGVELAARGGESVRAVAPGVVRYAGWFRGYGKLVIIDQGDDYFTVLSHLDDVFVEPGAAVAAGDTLGSVGDTGSLSGPSLYFEVRHGSEPLDPAAWLRPDPVTASGKP